MGALIILVLFIFFICWVLENIDPPAPRPGSAEEQRLHTAAMRQLEIQIAKERGYRDPDDVI